MIRVRVPASSANMGAGFDTLGIALNLYSVVEVSQIESGLEIKTLTRGGTAASDKSNLIYRAMERVFEKVGFVPTGIRIEQHSNIPMTRGLGSSSACIAGGMLAANVMSGRQLSYSEIADLAAKMEGHPDNIGPAIYGGLCISADIGDKAVVKSTKICHNLKFAALVPDFFVATRKSRVALPESVKLRDATSNISSALMFYQSMVSGDFDMLRYGVQDTLHQPYRKKYIDGFSDIFNKTYEYGSLATYLSGSGPTIMSILSNDGDNFKQNIEQFFRENSYNWKCLMLECDNVGAVVSVTD